MKEGKGYYWSVKMLGTRVSLHEILLIWNMVCCAPCFTALVYA